MKMTTNNKYTVASRRLGALLALGALTLAGTSAYASVAYGTINNFDTVNDTAQICYGFEIELDDIDSQDITYCYSYNHYGTPNIREDSTSVPGHTNVFVRYAAILTNGVWSAYTAIPSGPIAPTLGHQFTNPSLNFGGEHFGVGYYGQPTAIKYNWLLDNGAGVLVQGPAVMVSTPTFTYYPPVGAAAAQVQAEIKPAPEVQVRESGTASWVKAIVTTAHTNREIRLRDLVSPDPAYPKAKDWRNGEPDEVETEWSLLQMDFGSRKTNNLVGAAQDLPHGDEIVSRRYEFYTYAGPTDPATGKALATKVGTDGIHGINQNSNTVVVGEYLGAQMSGYDHELAIGLIDHLADGAIDTVYPTRTIVVAGVPFTATMSGALPTGLTFDAGAGILSGTPTQSGVFTFKVRVSATNNPAIEKSYTFAIPAADVVLAPHSTVDTVSEPLDSGNTTGTGLYTNGVNATVTATAIAGYTFACWTDNGTVVSSNAAFQFPVDLNRSLVANFVSVPRLAAGAGSGNTLVFTWPTNFTGFVLEKNTDLHSTNWVNASDPVTVVGTNNRVSVSPVSGSGFFRLMRP